MSKAMSSGAAARVLTAAAVALSGALAACQNNQYLGRRDTIMLGAGDAVAHNTAVQTVDPWPRYSGDRRLTHDGKRILLGVQRYQKNESIEPKGLATTDTLTSGSDTTSGGGQP